MSDFLSNTISTVEELEALYGKAVEGSLKKELTYISAEYRKLIEHSPFVVVATSGPEGLDCSPRGDPAGFVRVYDNQTVMLPDRRGNNRLDTLKNIVRDQRISLLFLIPGLGETLRINGTAKLSIDQDLCQSFEMKGKPPKSVIVVTVDRVYFQCKKALARSRLWDPEARVDPATLPSAGDILKTVLDDSFDGDAYDKNYPERMKSTMY
jgi:PPOX class probable FMN-dependent enzyme